MALECSRLLVMFMEEMFGDEGGHEDGQLAMVVIMVIIKVNLRNPNIFNSSETLNVKNEGSLKQR